MNPVADLAERFGVEPDKMLGVLRGTIIKRDKNGRDATNEEIVAFAIVANQYGLNPFTREIHAFVDAKRGGVVPVVGIDGWARKVNEQDRFDGCSFEFMDAPDGKPHSCTCTMHVRDRAEPISLTEYFSECYRATPAWDGMPRRMLRHKAFIQAARIAFSLAGIYDEDEALDIIENGERQVRTIARPQRKALPVELTSPAALPAPANGQTREPVREPIPPADAAEPPPAVDAGVDQAPQAYAADAALELKDGEMIRIRGSLMWDAEQKNGRWTMKIRGSDPNAQPIIFSSFHAMPVGLKRDANVEFDCVAKFKDGKAFYNVDNVVIL